MSLPWSWPPVLTPSLTSDNVANESDVPGANVTEALNALQAQLHTMRALLPAPMNPPPGGYDLAWDYDPNIATDPDLLANGWNVTLTNSPYTVITRSGDVISYETRLTTFDGAAYNPTPPAGTYRSTLRDGRLLIQTARGEDISIWRETDGTIGRFYGMGVGGGPRDNNYRQAWISNGAIGAANVAVVTMNDNGSPALSVATPLTPVTAAAAGAPARNFFFNLPDLTNTGNGIGKWIQATVWDLWAQSAPPNVDNLLQADHGVAPRPPTARVGLRLRTEYPFTNNGNADRHYELYYIRRQPWRAQWR